MTRSTGSNSLYASADIDECAKDNGGCTDKCSNLQGSYVCSCEDDKKTYLDEDKHTCNGESGTHKAIMHSVSWYSINFSSMQAQMTVIYSP